MVEEDNMSEGKFKPGRFALITPEKKALINSKKEEISKFLVGRSIQTQPESLISGENSSLLSNIRSNAKPTEASDNEDN